MPNAEKGKRVYLAGSLFDLRHLAGNAMLGESLELRSEGRYSMYLPQDYEPANLEAKAIRDADFNGLLSCDAAVFQFDGTELDSGTVAEFMVAKFADVPSVLLRTDFRKGGDRNAEPWNLMCSFYPRTVSLVADAMELYVSGAQEGRRGLSAVQHAVDSLADRVLSALDEALASEAVALDDALDHSDRLRRLLGLE